MEQNVQKLSKQHLNLPGCILQRLFLLIGQLLLLIRDLFLLVSRLLLAHLQFLTQHGQLIVVPFHALLDFADAFAQHHVGLRYLHVFLFIRTQFTK